jgi:hypothetical protein
MLGSQLSIHTVVGAGAILAVITLLGATYYGGRNTMRKELENTQLKEAYNAVRESARKTDELQRRQDEREKESQKKIAAIESERIAAVKRLRQLTEARPVRVPSASRSDCPPATGADLSREDTRVLTEFFTGEAALADSREVKFRESLDAQEDYRNSLGVSRGTQ